MADHLFINMKAIIVLGNKLNDDETLSNKALKRCDMVLNANSFYKPDRIIISGGIANEKTSISEAKAMYNHLVNDLKMDSNLFILEEKSTTTTENAIFSFEICQKENIDEVMVISSIEHFDRVIPKNAISCFREVVKNYPNIKLIMYTENY